MNPTPTSTLASAVELQRRRYAAWTACRGFRKTLRLMLLDLVDGRWLGLCPLSRHIVICGFPRSGSTLLLLMVETSSTGNQSGAAVGRGAARRFEDFHARVPRRFDVTALNGVRPLDPDAITRWREPRHRDRMRSVIRDMPELGDVLIEMGYETDTSWMAGYRT